MNMGSGNMTPLVEGDRLQALRLAERRCRGSRTRTTPPRVSSFARPLSAEPRRRRRRRAGRASLGRARGLRLRRRAFQPARARDPGRSELRAHAGRHAQARIARPGAMRRIAQALGAWREGDAVLRRRSAPLQRWKRSPRSACRSGPRSSASRGIAFRLSSNALSSLQRGPKREFVRERDLLWDVLQSTW